MGGGAQRTSVPDWLVGTCGADIRIPGQGGRELAPGAPAPPPPRNPWNAQVPYTRWSGVRVHPFLTCTLCVHGGQSPFATSSAWSRRGCSARAWRIRASLLELSGTFSPKYFQSAVGRICGRDSCGCEGPRAEGRTTHVGFGGSERVLFGAPRSGIWGSPSSSPPRTQTGPLVSVRLSLCPEDKMETASLPTL